MNKSQLPHYAIVFCTKMDYDGECDKLATDDRRQHPPKLTKLASRDSLKFLSPEIGTTF